MGSTRPGRNGEAVAKWVYDHASKRADASFELLDLHDYHLPLFDEGLPAFRQYQHDHTRTWSEKIDGFDGYVFVTPEYNHGVPGALKNAIDYLYQEWNNKAAAFVSYGHEGGARAVEHFRATMVELQIATVRGQVMFRFETDFENWTNFRPSSRHEEALAGQLDQLVTWSRALRTVRDQSVQ
ncbi:NAD(P)H-dependent oxidoreductase [Actinoplanes sp. TBRC 11911]|nr:NAD(P)H-dependent oxidoreductase [Actinoplanes sp. TBRC 11911]